MSEKAVSENGLLYFFQKLKEIFVRQETGKVLSSNDYTTAEKTKLSGISEGANKTVVENVLTSTSTDNALSSYQGKVLDEKIKALSENMGDLGYGDMMKAVYDTDNNGKVDNADNSDKLGGQPSSYYAPSSHTHQQSEINGFDTVVDTITEIASGKCKSKVFDTVADLDTWLSNSSNTAPLNVGDIFLIRAVEVPDYWWDGSAKQILETTKVEIEYITNAEIDTIVAS